MVSLELVAVAVPAPLYQCFDYRVPADWRGRLRPGMRVRVPFGRREVLGIVLEPPHEISGDPAAYRPLAAVLDAQPLLPAELVALARWAMEYYRHPPGEALAAMLPGPLRRGDEAQLAPRLALRLTDAGAAALPGLPPRHRAQRALLERLAAGPLAAEALPRDAARRRAEALGWIEAVAATAAPAAAVEPSLALTPAQAEALASLRSGSGFRVSLLEGVTGSGKTELYLQRIADVLAAGQQALVLAPEIGLTPQLVERFTRRFGASVAAYHSGLGEGERTRTWLRARAGELGVVIGTRSAAFVPFARLGLIVVDEEHDSSYKQQEGFRYSARDLAVVRAQRLGIPLILGSATPALETLHNARSGRYQHLRLPLRVGERPPPRVQTLDLRGQVLEHGLSEPLLAAVARHLDAGGQVLLFINRRGYAPLLLCHACGWFAPCSRCDARMTLHRGRRRLICHHCGIQQAVPPACPQCGGRTLLPVGEGTERIEDALRNRFPGQRCERFDSDRLAKKGELERLLAGIRSGEVRLLVGTQILAKGHDFPGLSLVGIVSADQALYGADFRAIERMGQLVTQVAGRAGRGPASSAGEAPVGEVLLQTHEPGHPALRRLIDGGYPGLADLLLAEREAAGLPPYAHLALLRAEATDPQLPLAFLGAVAELLAPLATGVSLSEPVPAPMERRGGYVRAQLLLQSASRAALQALLAAGVGRIDRMPEARRVRWSVDVDPADLF